MFNYGHLWSQYDQNYFRSPINGQTLFSGSFGEPRTRHFHAGVDFKPTLGYLKDTIFAVADGWISRINVRPDGYGNCLYIDHPNGYTSVYAHLRRFEPSIKDYIESELYKQKKYAIDHYPKKGALRVKKGQPIGLMGNTGRSSGVHLHFEIRETDSEIPVNPALFGLKPLDDQRPVIRGVVIYSVLPDEQVVQKKYLPVTYLGNGQYKLKNEQVTVGSLLIGIGIHAYDTMNGARNHNGIYSLKTMVNGEKVFAFQLDKVGFDHTHYLHAHMDYAEKVNNRYVTKSYKNQRNPLPIYEINEDNGLINVFENIPSAVHVEVSDIEGNISTIDFTVKRDTQLINLGANISKTDIRIQPNDSMTISLGEVSIEVRPGTFVEPINLNINESEGYSVDLSQPIDHPLFRSIRMSAPIEYKKNDQRKYIYVSKDNKGRDTNNGGQWIGDSTLTTYISELKAYKIVRDQTPPTIDLQIIPSPTNSRLAFKVTDNYIPQSRRDEIKYDVYLDGNWQLCTHDAKTDRVSCGLSEMNSGSQHKFMIRAIDSCGNETIVEQKFVRIN